MLSCVLLAFFNGKNNFLLKKSIRSVHNLSQLHYNVLAKGREYDKCCIIKYNIICTRKCVVYTTYRMNMYCTCLIMVNSNSKEHLIIFVLDRKFSKMYRQVHFDLKIFIYYGSRTKKNPDKSPQ